MAFAAFKPALTQFAVFKPLRKRIPPNADLRFE
jgi:hypothetical protein